MAMKVKKLYSYSKQTYLTFAEMGVRAVWLKVGETVQQTAQDRVDQQVLDALKSKASTQQELLNYLKANLDKGDN